MPIAHGVCTLAAAAHMHTYKDTSLPTCVTQHVARTLHLHLHTRDTACSTLHLHLHPRDTARSMHPRSKALVHACAHPVSRLAACTHVAKPTWLACAHPVFMLATPGCTRARTRMMALPQSMSVTSSSWDSPAASAWSSQIRELRSCSSTGQGAEGLGAKGQGAEGLGAKGAGGRGQRV